MDAWSATTLDISKILRGATRGDAHTLVTDVIESFDTVGRSVLDCALRRLGMPDWLRKTNFWYRADGGLVV